jgi:DNA-binding CsgD family transcriptional regulator
VPSAGRVDVDDLVGSENWDAIEQLSERHATRLALDEPDFWPTVFDVAPDDWVRARPRVRQLRAIIQRLRAGATIDAGAFEAFSAWVDAQQRPAARDRLTVQLRRLQYLLALGRFAEARSVADDMDAEIRRAEDFTGFDDALGPLLLRMGTAHLLAGNVDGAIGMFTTAVRWASSAHTHPVLRHARNHLALGYALRGNIRRARSEAMLDSDAEPAPAGSLAQAYEKGTQYVPVLIALAELDRAAAATAISNITIYDDSPFWWLDAAVRARFALIWGECEPAARDIELEVLAHARVCGPGSFARGMLHGLLAALWFASGHADRVGPALDEAVDSPAGPWLEASRARLRATGLAGPASSARAAPHIIEAVAAERRGAIGERDRHIERARRSIELDGDASALIEASTPVAEHLMTSLGIDSTGIRLIGDAWPLEQLTAREIEVLRALRQHTTVRSLAAGLFVSANTVKTHLRNVYRKLGVSTRAGALAAAESMALDVESWADVDLSRG